MHAVQLQIELYSEYAKLCQEIIYKERKFFLLFVFDSSSPEIQRGLTFPSGGEVTVSREQFCLRTIDPNLDGVQFSVGSRR